MQNMRIMYYPVPSYPRTNLSKCKIQTPVPLWLWIILLVSCIFGFFLTTIIVVFNFELFISFLKSKQITYIFIDFGIIHLLAAQYYCMVIGLIGVYKLLLVKPYTTQGWKKLYLISLIICGVISLINIFCIILCFKYLSGGNATALIFYELYYLVSGVFAFLSTLYPKPPPPPSPHIPKSFSTKN